LPSSWEGYSIIIENWAGQYIIDANQDKDDEIGRSSIYVFALPARYNFAYPTGFEEVESIISGNPLRIADN
jgi:hypothetical protein